MKLHQSRPSGQNLFTGYGEGYVSVNGQEHRSSVLVMQDSLDPWSVTRLADITAADFEALLARTPEVVILGTGNALAFPDLRLSRSLAQARIGLEVMDTRAACRTYNILAAEGRRVLAALILG
jgi:uncharacterized protein